MWTKTEEKRVLRFINEIISDPQLDPNDPDFLGFINFEPEEEKNDLWYGAMRTIIDYPTEWNKKLAEFGLEIENHSNLSELIINLTDKGKLMQGNPNLNNAGLFEHVKNYKNYNEI